MQPSATPRYGVPLATYRLQLTPAFGFQDAAAVVPYLARLGVSHIYLSPFLEAVDGSEHGYDVTDHSKVRREFGGLGGLHALAERLSEYGLGLIADFVPNHVGIGARNDWWEDVLRYGRESPYEAFFDIDWEAQPQMERGVLWYPLLGQTFGRALEAGEIRLALRESEPWVTYFDHALPLAPAHYARTFGIPPTSLPESPVDATSLPRLADILEELRSAPRERSEDLRTEFRRLLRDEPALERWASARLDEWNGQGGDSASFDRLEALLLDQHYRLSDWRVSGEEINYRRFFDQNNLAAIRVERDDVFEATHALLFELVRAGIVTGVRIDHVDGLYDPDAYLSRLRARLDEASAGLGHVPIFVEKILQPGEDLPSWQVEGTTGYEFINVSDNLLTDQAGMREMRRAYAQFTGQRGEFSDAAHDGKAHMAATAFSGEVSVLAWQLYRIAQRHRLHRDNTLRSLRRAITEVLACFPVYRTYATEDFAPGNDFIEHAIREAARRDHTLSASALEFLREVLQPDGALPDDERARRLRFRSRFQQISGPVMAKGVEDTAFYRFTPLLSLNEVGSGPGWGLSPADVHAWFGERLDRVPAGMLATSTHDTKRSEDARARLDVLSEMPATWRQEVRDWYRLTERHRRRSGRVEWPGRAMEWYLYQTLVCSWPTGGPDEAYAARISEHMVKAAREAKTESSWISPNLAYEAALTAFVQAILAPNGAAVFQRRVARFVEQIRSAGFNNSLALLTVKCLAPGFPDFYQGTELPTFTLTDPDNRRRVDFESREAILNGLRGSTPPPISDPASKLWLSCRLLEIRRSGSAATCGSYTPIASDGPRQDHVFAFARQSSDQRIVAVVPRLPVGMQRAAPTWEGTTIALHGDWTNLLTGKRGSGGDCQDLFHDFPVAVVQLGPLS